MIHVLYTKITEVNSFVFAYRLFHEDFSPIYGENKLTSVSLCIKLSIEHSTMCDSRINLNYTCIM